MVIERISFPLTVPGKGASFQVQVQVFLRFFSSLNFTLVPFGAPLMGF